MPLETEIKFRVADLAALAARLESAGFRLETPRSFESNVLYDTPDRQMRARTEILRIRSYAGRWTLTHKRLPGAGIAGEDRHKHRIETETGVAHGDALAEFFGMPVTDLRRDTPAPEALSLVPEAMARENLAIPIRVDDDGLHVAVAQPSDDLRFQLAGASGMSVRLSLAPMTDIRWAIDRSYQAIDSVGKLVQVFEAVETTRNKRPVEPEAPAVVSENAPVVQVVDSILTQAVRDRASDVHIEPSQDVIYVRFRIDGALKDVLELPVTMGIGLISRIKILAGINIVEKRRSQDGQFTKEIDGKDTDVRVSTAATIWGKVRPADPGQEPVRAPPRRPRHAHRHP